MDYSCPSLLFVVNIVEFKIFNLKIVVLNFLQTPEKYELFAKIPEKLCHVDVLLDTDNKLLNREWQFEYKNQELFARLYHLSAVLYQV